MRFRILAAVLTIGWLAAGPASAQPWDPVQPPGVVEGSMLSTSPTPSAEVLMNPTTKSSAYPQGDFASQLGHAQGEGCGSCGDDWGCGGSPFHTGPGKCDNWRVGPHWQISVQGVIMQREGADLAALATAVGTTIDTADLTEDFDHGVGVRASIAGYFPQMRGYQTQLQYFGVEEWNASVVAPLAAVAAPPAGSVALNEQRLLTYRSKLHSLELNFQRPTESVWKHYGGVRYMLYDEQIIDHTNQFSAAPLSLGDVEIPIDRFVTADVENNLIGFQMGVRRDTWQLSRRLFLQGFSSGGLYCNLIDRDTSTNTTQTRTEIVGVDNPATPDVNEQGQVRTTVTNVTNGVGTERTELAYGVEGSLALVWKLNRCTALKGGYEVLYLDGLETAQDAFLGIGPNSQDLLLHGWFAGLEYRR